MALTEAEWTAIRNSWENPNGIWRQAGYDAHDKVWFMIDAATRTYRTEEERIVKAEYLNYEIQSIQLKEPWIENLRTWEIVEPRTPIEVEYPKNITRGPYTIRVDNFVQEEQAKEFLGIEPPGDELDTWLSKRDLAGLEQWKSYWTEIFTNVGMAFWIDFVNNKFQEYKDKLPVIEKTWWEKAIDFIAGLTTVQFLPFFKTDPLMKIIQDGIIKKADREKFDLPEWVWEAGLAIFLIDLEDFADETIITGTVPLTPAANFYSLLKSNSFPRVLDYLKANPGRAVRAFPKLNDLTKAQILKGLRKDRLAITFTRELEKANYSYGVAQSTPLWLKAANFFRKPKTLLFGTFGLIAGISTIYGYVYSIQWAAKEALVELVDFFTSDMVRDYDRNPTKKLYDLIMTNLDRLEKNAILARDIIKGISWLWPFTKEMWDTYADDVVAKVDEYRKRMDLIPIPEVTGTLTIRPTPTDAKVSVSGQIPTTGIFSAELPIGTYSVTVSKFGYLSATFEAEVKEGVESDYPVVLGEEVKPPVPPEEMEGKLIISVTPEDALIEVSGQEEITTAGTYTLLQGFYNIKASKEGYETQITTAYVKDQEEERASFILKEIVIPPEISVIRIESDPIGARIFIDGKDTFNITNTSLQIESGAHTLTLKKREFLDEEIEFEIKEGESLLFDLILQEIPVPPEPVPATITITSEPSDADIYIDGAYTFTKTPYTVVLDAGSYIIRCQKEGYYPTEVIAEIAEGEVDEISLTLNIIPPDAPPLPPYIPYDPVYPTGYETLWPVSMAPLGFEPTAPPEEAELLVNIETTDSKPWKGRIYSIALLDLTAPGTEPVVLVNDNEEELIREFLSGFESRDFKRLVGFKLTFDHRYIFHKIMLYKLQSKKWADIDLKDVKQLMDQVKEEFVYFPDKTGTLDNYGKSLLGKGKYGTQKEILTQFLAGNYDYVKAFQERQLEITNGLYQLFRFSSSESFSAPVLPRPDEVPSPETPLGPESAVPGTMKICRTCNQENPLINTECLVCGQALGP